MLYPTELRPRRAFYDFTVPHRGYERGRYRSGRTQSPQKGRKAVGGSRGKVSADACARRAGSLRSKSWTLTGSSGSADGMAIDSLGVPIAERYPTTAFRDGLQCGTLDAMSHTRGIPR